jgi:hypothetical protein
MALYQEFQKSFPKEKITEEKPSDEVNGTLTFESKANHLPAPETPISI